MIILIDYEPEENELVQEENGMKKIAIAALAVMMILAGCSNSTPEPEKPKLTENEIAAVAFSKALGTEEAAATLMMQVLLDLIPQAEITPSKITLNVPALEKNLLPPITNAATSVGDVEIPATEIKSLKGAGITAAVNGTNLDKIKELIENMDFTGLEGITVTSIEADGTVDIIGTVGTKATTLSLAATDAVLTVNIEGEGAEPDIVVTSGELKVLVNGEEIDIQALEDKLEKLEPDTPAPEPEVPSEEETPEPTPGTEI